MQVLMIAEVVVSLLLCIAGFVQSDSVEDGYSGEVKALFKRLTNYQGNVANATEKMKSIPNKDLDESYAIAIINLYTQESTFYSILNEQMRKNYTDKTTDIWRKAGDLINRGLDILGPTAHEKVYRGCKSFDILPDVGSTNYSFNQITSTSKSFTTALSFLCLGGFLFEIENVYGVSVQEYSAIRNEQEVILKSTEIFEVKSCSKSKIIYTKICLIGKANVNGVGKTDSVDLLKYTFSVAFIWIINEYSLV